MSLYKDISILVVTPAYGGQIFAGYLTSLLKFERLCKDKNILVDYEFCYNESLIPRARNTLAHTFMNSTKYTHLLCLDADIEFEPEDIIKMLDYNKPLVGGVYPKKKINWEKVTELVNQNNENKLTTDIIQTMTKEPVVLEKMREKFPNDIYNATNINYFRYFDTELKDGIYLSEDYWFCDRWRQLGGNIYIYTKFRCRHWGTYAY